MTTATHKLSTPPPPLKKHAAGVQLLVSPCSCHPHPASSKNLSQVFSAFCTKLMGSLFEILPETSSPSLPLKAAVAALVSDALFHEENLEGYREALVAAEAAEAAAVAAAAAARAGSMGGMGGAGAGHSVPGEEFLATTNTPNVGAGVKRKRKRKNARGGEGDGTGVNSIGDGISGGNGGGGTKPPRRVCYQQQLLEEMAYLAGSKVESARLGAIAGAPVLLEGFIVRLARAQHNTADIHKAAGVAAAAAISASGGKRSRGSGPASHSGGGGGASLSLSPASQMFKMWAVLMSTLSGPPPSSPTVSGKRGEPEADKGEGKVAPASDPAVSVRMPTTSTSLTGMSVSLPPSLVLAFLRSSNSMLRLLAAHDVYRINEDWGGVEFDRLRTFSGALIDLAASRAVEKEDEEREKSSGGGGNATAEAEITATATAVAAQVNHEAPAGAVAQEFVTAFQSLLRLNHNILHDDLRPVLRMTFQWAAAAIMMAPENEATVTDAVAVSEGVGGGDGGGSGGSRGGRSGEDTLRAQAVGLVVSLVDTYGRLRQMDHLVQAMFGAIIDRPSAAADMLRSSECTEALGR